MKKLILILMLALGLVLVACTPETRVVVISATPLPPTVTPRRPTPRPIPPTRTREPTEVPLEERYINYFVEKGFEESGVPGQYRKNSGRGSLMVSFIEEVAMFGHVGPADWTEEERTLIFDHLQEAATFLNPEEGWAIVLGAIDAMDTGISEGFAHTAGGRELFFRLVPLDDGTTLVEFKYMSDTFEHVDLYRTVYPIMNPANEHYYEAVAVSGGIDWFDARVAAGLRTFEGIHGHLATITSVQEDNFIARMFPQAVADKADVNDSTVAYWLGGFQPPNSDEPDKDWQWITDEPFVYTNWHPSEPNQYQGHEEDCLHYRASPMWNDDECVFLWGGYVVEYDPEWRK